MGKTEAVSLMLKVKTLLFKDERFLSSKKEVNWKFVKQISVIGTIVAVFVLLLLPETKPEIQDFHAKVDDLKPQQTEQKPEEPNPNMDTWEQMKSSQSSASSALRGVDSYNSYLGGSSNRTGGGSGSQKNHNTSMVLSRSGSDSRFSLPSGAAIRVRIVSRITVSSDPMPVIGVIIQDVVNDSMLAIPSGSKLYGEATFDESTEKAQILWRSIVMNDNRRRDIQAIAVTDDGQAGIYGDVKSNALKNVVGHTVTGFIAAYAEGSMTRSMLGVSTGGVENGLKQAISDTAKDQAEQWGNDLKKEKKWVEISSGTESQAVITSPFQFRDVGVVY